MPIGDLLAEIGGGPASAKPTLQPSTLKRKADNQLSRDDTSKASRPSVSSTAVQRQPSRPLDRPTTHRSPAGQNGTYTGTGGLGSSLLSAKPISSTNRITKSTPRPGPSTARPNPSADAGPPKAVKKGSFAAIMARGQRAQATMGQVGKIQHRQTEKKVESPRELPARVNGRPVAKSATKDSGYSGTSKPGQRNGGQAANGAGAGRIPGKPVRGGVQKATATPEPEKKLKKAASATTGYTGTARPRPGATTSKKDPKAARGGALLNPPKFRPSSSRGHEDDYDEDMDDFIDYDDEEDEQGPRYGYASDGSSDMEAGLDDIDDEEQRAERIARQEDIEEQRLEDRLRAEKAARKRALDARNRR